VHFPELTLGQTLTFAAATQRPRSEAPEVGRDVAAKFKLNAAYNTPVGNAMIRGLSGGEKRRTSIAEVFISETRLQCWDNSTRGLDSATALSFVRLLWSSTAHTQATVVMSIYQASNAIYEVRARPPHTFQACLSKNLEFRQGHAIARRLSNLLWPNTTRGRVFL
jgi:ATP-binding cassette, subfamily G (WHITE), member 2, PDR